jgi:hypothetical protein
MQIIIVGLLYAAAIALIVAQVGGALGALFFGRKLPWLWFALAVLVLMMKVVYVAMYREGDAPRALISLAAGFVAAALALILQRRFPAVVLVVGGFLAGGLTTVQVLGPLLNPAPQWLVIAIIALAGIGAAIWTQTNRATAVTVLSALIGAGVLADLIVDFMGIDETLRFQVYAVLALLGIGFQVWMERRERRAIPAPAQGVAQ